MLKTLTPSEVRLELAAGSTVLIDVREPAEHAAEAIEGAKLAPLSSFDPRRLPDCGGRRVVFYCGSGKRSATAVERCRQAGVSLDAHLGGGIAAWKAAGLPVVRPGSSPAAG